jgi:hypothetical protein
VRTSALAVSWPDQLLAPPGAEREGAVRFASPVAPSPGPRPEQEAACPEAERANGDPDQTREADLFLFMLKTECFPYSADFPAADPGRMIAPAASDEVKHIRQLLISEPPPELRHGDSGGCRLCGWHG